MKSVEITDDIVTQVAYIDSRSPREGANGVAARVRNEGVGLVVALGQGPGARALAGIVRSLPETRFLFIDASLRELSLEGVPNAAAIRFAEEDVLFLGGYLAGLMPAMANSTERVDRVSVVAAAPDRDTRRLLAAFRRGLGETSPGATIRVDYSHELQDPTACERLANRQVDEGSDVVVASPAAAVSAPSKWRGLAVFGASGPKRTVSSNTPTCSCRRTRSGGCASHFAVQRLLAGVLPMGRDTVLGLEDDYSTGVGFSNLVPPKIASLVVRRCSQVRATRHRDF